MTDRLAASLSKRGLTRTAKYVSSPSKKDAKFVSIHTLLKNVVDPLLKKAETDNGARQIVTSILPLLQKNTIEAKLDAPVTFKVEKPGSDLSKYASVVEELFVDGPYSERLVKIAAYVAKGQGNTGLSIKGKTGAHDVSLLWVPESWYEGFVGQKFSKELQKKADVVADAMLKLALAPRYQGQVNPNNKLQNRLTELLNKLNGQIAIAQRGGNYSKEALIDGQRELQRWFSDADATIQSLQNEIPAIQALKQQALQTAYNVRQIVGQISQGTGYTNKSFQGQNLTDFTPSAAPNPQRGTPYNTVPLFYT